MAKKKILIVGKLPPPFIGPAIATNIILNSELKNSYELLHVNTAVNKTVEEFGKGKWDKVGKNIAIYKKLFHLLRRKNPGLILIPISQTTLGFLKDSVFILLASLFSSKILLQLRGSNFKNWMKSANIFTRTFVRFCFNRSQGMIVLGNNLKHLFEEYYPLEKIHVIPNGCDIFIPEPNQQFDKIQLLYFANFLPAKGIKEVLQALLLLEQEGINNFELTAVGAWDNDIYKKECMDLLKHGEVSATFHEPMSGTTKWQTFANADIFLFTPNKPEGHPWVIVEALSAGLPIISSDQGAIVESVLDGKNGFIVDPTHIKNIAEALRLLLTSSEERNEFGKNSKAQYLNKFTERQMVENFTRVFENVLV
ncbi:MAG: glycosyltransferase family 4 protein [Flavobacteriales bacterium]|nr:glycosyltransferase family 4 protein [Flavobacteriales bacterium]